MKALCQEIDPARVPRVCLGEGGARMPVIGMGTFGSDRYDARQVAVAVEEAAALGYRHFDCAAVYGNEGSIGDSLATVITGGGIPRDSLWVTSKVWNDHHDDVAGACRQSLEDLRLDYLDLYLVHWPFPNFHPKGCPADYHNPDARPYNHSRFMETWGAMERLQQEGLVRCIGTSNMTQAKMTLLLRDCSMRPVVNEMELHPHCQQPELFDFMVGRGIRPVGFCPLGSPSRPERDRTTGDSVDMEDPVIVRIARRLDMHPAEVCIMWSIQRGAAVIPFSVKRKQLLANLRAAAAQRLSQDDMQAISGTDRHCRLIKGQVFLWRRGQTWEDLWDEDGRIAE